MDIVLSKIAQNLSTL